MRNDSLSIPGTVFLKGFIHLYVHNTADLNNIVSPYIPDTRGRKRDEGGE